MGATAGSIRTALTERPHIKQKRKIITRRGPVATRETSPSVMGKLREIGSERHRYEVASRCGGDHFEGDAVGYLGVAGTTLGRPPRGRWVAVVTALFGRPAIDKLNRSAIMRGWSSRTLAESR